MKELSNLELTQINGGDFFETIFAVGFASGYAAGTLLDAAHGLWDGLMGVEAH
ncbi:bacteriocin [Winogradskyella sp.]|uniref:bacteriocin n=1 Tax=Winogradskyella sp. TaxID=1883156 RepID=UPI002616834C|nr:bacteriocin [Winogradskyella sp.]